MRARKRRRRCDQADRLLGHLRLCDGRRLANADDQRRRQGAGAQAALLSAAIDQRRDAGARPAPDIERADALRPVHLVAGNRRKIDTQSLTLNGYFSNSLRRVGVEQGARVAADRGDLAERLEHADLVVRRHHRDDGGALVDRVAALFRDRPGRRHRRRGGDAETVALQRLRRFEHAFMLGRDGDDMVA